jgi:hypothetical protein
LLFAAKQHSCGGLQQSEPPAQQSLVLALVARTQHSCGGKQQSEPLAQQSLVVALVARTQHSCGGLQQSLPGEQQSKFWCAAPPATHRAPVMAMATNALVNMENLP